MTNHDRLLQFLYDTHKVRCEFLTGLAQYQMKFYMTTFDDEKLVYTANGGDSATLFVFTLKGRFKYNAVVSINGATIGKKSVRSKKQDRYSGMFSGPSHVLDTQFQVLGTPGPDLQPPPGS